MSESESWKPVGYEVDGIVVFAPSSWERVDDPSGIIQFEHSSGLYVMVERHIFEREEHQLPYPNEIAMLKERYDPEIEWKSNPVMLASGAAMMSYRWGHLNDPEWVKLYCELCRYKSPGLLDVIRFGGAVTRDVLDHPEIVYWRHVWHKLARMTKFMFSEDDDLDLQVLVPDSGSLGLN